MGTITDADVVIVEGLEGGDHLLCLMLGVGVALNGDRVGQAGDADILTFSQIAVEGRVLGFRVFLLMHLLMII